VVFAIIVTAIDVTVMPFVTAAAVGFFTVALSILVATSVVDVANAAIAIDLFCINGVPFSSYCCCWCDLSGTSTCSLSAHYIGDI